MDAPATTTAAGAKAELRGANIIAAVKASGVKFVLSVPDIVTSAGLLRPILSEVNMVNAPVIARDRGITISESRQSQHGAYETYVRLTVKTDTMERSVAGTVFSDGRCVVRGTDDPARARDLYSKYVGS